MGCEVVPAVPLLRQDNPGEAGAGRLAPGGAAAASGRSRAGLGVGALPRLRQPGRAAAPERCGRGGGAGRRRGQWARAAVAMRAPTLPAGRAPRCAPPRRARARALPLPGWCAAGTKGRAPQVGAGAAGSGGAGPGSGELGAGRWVQAGAGPVLIQRLLPCTCAAGTAGERGSRTGTLLKPSHSGCEGAVRAQQRGLLVTGRAVPWDTALLRNYRNRLCSQLQIQCWALASILK